MTRLPTLPAGGGLLSTDRTEASVADIYTHLDSVAEITPHSGGCDGRIRIGSR
jgi:hypothetical protein